MEASKGQTLDRSEQAKTSRSGRKGLLASGSVIGAILASSCCILPVVLLSLGIGGAWMSNLTALEPYQPVFLLFTLGMLGVGFYDVYRKPMDACRTDACSTDGYCGTPLAERVIKIALWSATLLVVVVLAWPYIAPLFLG
ncbi:mercuric ion transport protein [Modicisalibacter ilicicola DSM 19980]|uniref:Mercuric transport protein MerT n=1 Tax=Modicisalibacter ilicicola DSM 19980 TaxID=1121942 RepID=A0A1M5B623_9GAMM|nr:mercuric transporter MerT family protein [Halomonas ilicicola]SHF37632.1 mercuric ion transport protein [Halomonas ilicicola DSM 19980]